MDRRTYWSCFRRVGSYRCGNRNHLRLICHGNLWNCTNHIGWSTQLDWRWWCAGHFGLADLNSVGVRDLNCGLNCRWLQLVDMSTPNNPWCHLHLVHQWTCLVDNQSWAPLQIPSIIPWHHWVTNLSLTMLSTLLIRGPDALLLLLVNHLAVQVGFHQIYNPRQKSWNTCVRFPFPNVDLGITAVSVL